MQYIYTDFISHLRMSACYLLCSIVVPRLIFIWTSLYKQTKAKNFEGGSI